MLKMKVFRHNNQTISYEFGRWYRIINLFFAFFLLLGASLYSTEDWFSWLSFPVVISVVLILAGLYLDSWSFDSKNGIIFSRIGLIGLNKKRVYQLDDITSFSLTHFSKGYQRDRGEGKRKRSGEIVVFSVHFLSGENRDIEIIREAKSGGMTELYAQNIADYCGKPLTKDREMDLNLGTRFGGRVRSRMNFRQSMKD
ncbi:MAG: hypothetical protein HQ557_16770 [Bacteroidetes bacterium]|nr:hypothetical protein [Bacteroidota bacterium]